MNANLVINNTLGGQEQVKTHFNAKDVTVTAIHLNVFTITMWSDEDRVTISMADIEVVVCAKTVNTTQSVSTANDVNQGITLQEERESLM